MSSEQDVANAVGRARTAQPSWASQSVADRCAAVSSFVELSKGRSEEIACLIAMETGRPIRSARDNVSFGIEYFHSYLAHAEEWLAPVETLSSVGEIHRVVREPWGVIATIAPWNYPFLNVAWQCGQAILAGNTIVFKNSENNPLFAKLIAEIVADSDIPNGVFNVVYGDGQVGAWLANSDVDMISFTGSSTVGKHLARCAAEKFIPIITELGGSAPLVVFEDVEVNPALAELIFNRRFANCGQLCDAGKRLIVHHSHFDALVEAMCDIVTTRKVGDALEEETEIGPLVSQRQLDTLQAQVADAVDKGAKVHTGGGCPPGLEGAYYSPTILTNISFDMRVWREETFGPVLPIVSFATEDEAIQLANDTPYGLGAYLITDDNERFSRVARQMQSGMVTQNAVMYWKPENPFGGYKQSGMGRTNGQYGFHDVTQVKLISQER